MHSNTKDKEGVFHANVVNYNKFQTVTDKRCLRPETAASAIAAAVDAGYTGSAAKGSGGSRVLRRLKNTRESRRPRLR